MVNIGLFQVCANTHQCVHVHVYEHEHVHMYTCTCIYLYSARYNSKFKYCIHDNYERKQKDRRGAQNMSLSLNEHTPPLPPG